MKKTRTKGLNKTQLNEVNELISKAVNMALGDMAEYLNYLNDRIQACEDKLGIETNEYLANEIGARYGFPENKRK